MNTTQAGITTSPELIKILGEKLYSNPLPLILVRELLQNSVDAILALPDKKGKIDITVNISGRDINITCEDTGIGMDIDILTNVFLCIGKSKKHSESSTGGFGIAKVSLFATDEWELYTLDNYASGNGNSGDIQIKTGIKPKRKGTIVTAKITCDYANWKCNKIESYIRLSIPASKKIKVYYNGSKVESPFTQELKPVYQGDNYTIYTGSLKRDSKDNDNYRSKVYRINGLVQFTDYLTDDVKGLSLVVDYWNIGYKPRDNDYPFSLSRESLKSVSSINTIQKVLDDLTRDTMSLHRESSGTGRKKNVKIVREYAYFGKEFCQNDRRIMRIWELVLDVVRDSHKVLGTTDKVTYGLTDNDDTVACYWNHSEHGKLYLINPSFFVGKGYSIDGLILAIWSLACHEFSHELGNDRHNEEFTSCEGDVTRHSATSIMKEFTKIKIACRRIEL